MKDLLENYMNFQAEIKTKEHEIKKIELEEIKISGSNLEVNGDIKARGYLISNIENGIINKTDKITKLKKEIDELKLKISMIDCMINTLNDYHKEIIELKYKYNKKNSQIATIMEREERTIRKVLEKVINILDEKYNKFV